MGYAIGTVTGSSGDEAHYKVLAAIKTLAEANGWTTLRYDTSGANKELILHSTGLSGTESIYVGFRCFQSVAGDYYNIEVASMTGYLAGSIFGAQPGFNSTTVFCHNNAVTYFMTANAQRIVGCFKVGTPVYTHFYVGKFIPYARPGEYAMPLFNGSHHNGASNSRFSGSSQFPYYGGSNSTGVGAASGDYNSGKIRFPSGTWGATYHWPWNNQRSDNTNYCFGQPGYGLRPVNNEYQLLPVMMYITYNTNRGTLYGELDGVYAVSGHNNSTENVMQIGGTPVDQTGLTVLQAVDAIKTAGGRALIILQDLNRTGFCNYIALEMK